MPRRTLQIRANAVSSHAFSKEIQSCRLCLPFSGAPLKDALEVTSFLSTSSFLFSSSSCAHSDCSSEDSSPWAFFRASYKNANPVSGTAVHTAENRDSISKAYKVLCELVDELLEGALDEQSVGRRRHVEGSEGDGVRRRGSRVVSGRGWVVCDGAVGGASSSLGTVGFSENRLSIALWPEAPKPALRCFGNSIEHKETNPQGVFSQLIWLLSSRIASLFARVPSFCTDRQLLNQNTCTQLLLPRRAPFQTHDKRKT